MARQTSRYKRNSATATHENPFSGSKALLLGAEAVLVVLIVYLVSCMAGGTGSQTAQSATPTKTLDTVVLFKSGRSTYRTDMLIPAALAPVRPTKVAIEGTSSDGKGALEDLYSAIDAIEKEGYDLGFKLIDLNSGISVSYNADAAFYSASSLKGPYVVSLVEYNLGAGYSAESNRISNIITYSDNDAYSSLRYAYGSDCFAQLAEASGATSMSTKKLTDAIAEEAVRSENITDNNYEFVSASQLVALWQQCYTFLTSDAAGASWLAELFERPETSAIRTTAASLGTTWSKAGWYDDFNEAYDTTVDAGVVRTNTGDVILCVMTNDPEDFTAVESVVSQLLTLRSALTVS